MLHLRLLLIGCTRIRELNRGELVHRGGRCLVPVHGVALADPDFGRRVDLTLTSRLVAFEGTVFEGGLGSFELWLYFQRGLLVLYLTLELLHFFEVLLEYHRLPKHFYGGRRLLGCRCYGVGLDQIFFIADISWDVIRRICGHRIINFVTVNFSIVLRDGVVGVREDTDLHDLVQL